MNYLCISVRWLDDRYHGKDADGNPEWPPSPLRLFQALLASAFRRYGDTESLLEAFRWFQNEQFPAPLIVAPRSQPGQPFTRFVPNNDSDKKFDRQDRLAPKDVRPTFLLDATPIHYLWPFPEPIDESCGKHLDFLCEIARGLVVFGWGVDMATGQARILTGAGANYVDDVKWFDSVPDTLTDRQTGARVTLAGLRWLPVGPSAVDKLWRIPSIGSLDALLKRHDQFLNRLEGGFMTDLPPLVESAFRLVGYRRSTDLPARSYAAFAFYRPDGERRRSFSPLRAIAVAGMVRHLAAQMARQNEHHDPSRGLDDWVNDYVLGHGNGDGLRPRFSYLPLTTMRPPNILGGINRVLIAEPPGGAGNHAAWVRQALRGQILISNQQREEAILMTATDDWVLQRYVGKSDTWATVTPVVLPGSDDGKFAKTEKLFCKALRHAGLSTDALADLDFRNVSYWQGGELALKFHRPDYLKKDFWTVYHVRLRWKRAIPGPLAIGAGRHCGLGIFAAFD